MVGFSASVMWNWDRIPPDLSFVPIRTSLHIQEGVKVVLLHSLLNHYAVNSLCVQIWNLTSANCSPLFCSPLFARFFPIAPAHHSQNFLHTFIGCNSIPFLVLFWVVVPWTPECVPLLWQSIIPPKNSPGSGSNSRTLKASENIVGINISLQKIVRHENCL